MRVLLLIFHLGTSVLFASTMARPQDIGTGMMLAVDQLKQLAETGGGLQNQQSVEFLGQRMTGGLNMGFGEVMQGIPGMPGIPPLPIGG